MNDYEKKHIDILRKIAPECMVLLRSDGSFPLQKPCNVALYGSGARNTLKGGTGSGDVNVRHLITIEQGLERAGFIITTKKWLDNYEKVYVEARKTFVQGIKETAKAKGIPAIVIGMGAVMPEPEYELPLESEGELAVYVLSRISGEGSDRRNVKGDFLLTETEIRDIHALQKSHDKFLLVLNVGGVVDLTPVQDINNILLLSQTGMTIGDSFADVLLGKCYPSGKLTATWAANDAYCNVGTFGERDDTRYNEGIYVGYRYFDTINKTPLYPFGYGLGYTEFKFSDWEMKVEGTKVMVCADVENIGKRAGKETMQVYVSVPSGKLDQPYQMLAGFKKTKELFAGEKERIEVMFSVENLCSFDEESADFLLEKGDYVVRVGNSSRNTHICGVIRLHEDVIVCEGSHVGGKPDFIDWKPENAPWSYEDEVKEYEAASTYVIKKQDFVLGEVHEIPEVSAEIKALMADLSDSELAYLCVGNFKEEGSKSVIGAAAMSVAGAAGETTCRFLDKGIPILVMADGPAGLRLNEQYGIDEDGMYIVGETIPAAMREFVDEAFLAVVGNKKQEKKERHGEIHEQYCSAIPIGTALAQSWNEQLCEQCGDIVGTEMERFGVHLWLAPALNIQRNVLCGRNFEYYSEDPLIAGKTAASIVKGVQSKGIGATIKHFALNNNENNRIHSSSTASERAIREIYLKGFEIAVKEGKPWCLMTSYNKINGIHTSANYNLLTGVLREEWNYDGMVMTDWNAITHLWEEIPAGNNVKMPYRHEEETTLAKKIFKMNDNARAMLEKNAYYILKLVMKTKRFKEKNFETLHIVDEKPIKATDFAGVSNTCAGNGYFENKDEYLHGIGFQRIDPSFVYYRIISEKGGKYFVNMDLSCGYEEIVLELQLDGKKINEIQCVLPEYDYKKMFTLNLGEIDLDNKEHELRLLIKNSKGSESIYLKNISFEKIQ